MDPEWFIVNQKHSVQTIVYIIVYIYRLVGGIPTPLKNDGVRQLG